MEIAVQRRSLLDQPVGVGLATVMVIIVWGLDLVGQSTAVLLAILVLLLLGLRRPVWAMAAFLVSQLTLTSYMLNTPFGITISLRLLVLLLTGLELWRFRKQIELGPQARRVIIPTLILLVISTIANLVNSEFDFAFKDFRNMLVGLLAIIFMTAVTRNLKELKILCGVVFVMATASAVIGLLQHFGLSGTGPVDRVSGMAESEMELSFTLPITLLTVLGILLSKGVKDIRPLLGVSVLMMGLALYFTYTRSALLALALGLIALIIFLLTRIRGEIMLIIVLVAIGVIEGTGFMGDQYLSGRNEISQQESSISRKILWQAGFGIVQDNPFMGIGGDQYKTVSQRYISSIDPTLLRWEEQQYWGYRTLGSLEPHNDFLAVSIYYGVGALIAYIWLFMAAMRNLFDSYRATDKRFIKGLSIGVAAALISYAVNAFYHNGLATTALFWVIVGFSAAIGKVAMGKLNRKAVETSLASPTRDGG